MEASPAPAWPASGSCSHLGLRASREGTPRNPRLGVCVMGAGGRREDGVPGLSWVSHLPCRGPGCKLSSVPLAGGGPRSWCQDVLGSTPPPPAAPHCRAGLQPLTRHKFGLLLVSGQHAGQVSRCRDPALWLCPGWLASALLC